jgi:hypothetical protein
MRKYRYYIRTGNESIRAANGELASIYSDDGDPVPSELATANNEDLEPMTEFVYDWLMDPVIDYILDPLLRLWRSLKFSARKRPMTGGDIVDVDERILSAVAKVFVCVLAMLFLIAPIATSNIIEDQTLRVVITSLFCLPFVASAQLMGSRSMPLYTLVTA